MFVTKEDNGLYEPLLHYAYFAWHYYLGTPEKQYSIIFHEHDYVVFQVFITKEDTMCLLGGVIILNEDIYIVFRCS